jgi:hypothetical protein
MLRLVRVLENKHSIDVPSPPPPLRTCKSIYLEGWSCSDIGRALVRNDPAVRGVKGYADAEEDCTSALKLAWSYTRPLLSPT